MQYWRYYVKLGVVTFSCTDKLKSVDNWNITGGHNLVYSWEVIGSKQVHNPKGPSTQ